MDITEYGSEYCVTNHTILTNHVNMAVMFADLISLEDDT